MSPNDDLHLYLGNHFGNRRTSSHDINDHALNINMTTETIAVDPSPTPASPKFTPQALLSSPRRSTSIPNHNASLILYSVSEYDFDEHKKSSKICVLSVRDEKHETRTLVSGEEWEVGGWLGEGDEEQPVLLRTGEDLKGAVEVRVGPCSGEAGSFDEGYVYHGLKECFFRARGLFLHCNEEKLSITFAYFSYLLFMEHICNRLNISESGSYETT